jgi:O-antigen/teichoic acid export membrane protein
VGGLAGGLIGLLLLLAMPVLQAVTHGSGAALIALYLTFVCNIFLSIFRGIDQGQKRFLRLNLSFYIEVFGKTITLLLCLSWFPTITTVIGAVLMGMALALAYSLMANRQAEPSARPATAPQPLVPLLRQLSAIVAAQFLLQFLVTSDIILINYYSPYNAGAYAVVAKYGQLILFSFLSLQTVLFPILNRAAAERLSLPSVLRAVITGYFGLSLLVIVLYATFLPPTIPRFFGAAYADTAALLTLGAAVYCLLAFIHLLVNLFIIMHDARYLVALAAAAVTMLGSNIYYAQHIQSLLIAQIVIYTALGVVLWWLGSAHWWPRRV